MHPDAWLERARQLANSDAGLESIEAAWSAVREAAAHADSGDHQAMDEALGRWWAGYDAFLGVLTRGLPLQCRVGCSHCCADNPRGVTGVELRGLAQAVERHPDRARIWARVEESAQRWRERMERLGDSDLAVAESKADRDGCPLLSERGTCSVYAARPVACRAFFAITPPELCQQNHPDHQGALNPQLQPDAHVRVGLWEISDQLGLEELPDDLRSGLAAQRPVEAQ